MDLIKELTKYKQKDKNLQKIFKTQTDNKNILRMLKSLGKLPRDFKDNFILPLLFHKSQGESI